MYPVNKNMLQNQECTRLILQGGIYDPNRNLQEIIFIYEIRILRDTYF